MTITTHFLRYARPIVERFPVIAMGYRHMRDNKRIRDDATETPMGFKLIGNSVMETGVFEQEETKIVRRVLEKVDIVINVGANIGYYCCLSLQREKQVVAFEPVVSNLRYLYHNVRANHWQDRIEVFPIALSNRVGIIEIFGGGTSASLVKGWAGIPEQYVQCVATSTLDTVLGRRFYGRRCLVIVDIEGAEKFMLEGAKLLLSQEPKPIWMVEIAVSEHQPNGVAMNPHLLSTFQIFWRMGYEAWTADKRLHRVDPVEVETMVTNGRDNLFTHNFLFTEKGRMQDYLVRDELKGDE